MLLMINYETMLAVGMIFIFAWFVFGIITSVLYSVQKQDNRKHKNAGIITGGIALFSVFSSFLCVLYALKLYFESGADEEGKEMTYRDLITVYEKNDSTSTYRGNIEEFRTDGDYTFVEMVGANGKTIQFRFSGDQKFDVKTN